MSETTQSSTLALERQRMLAGLHDGLGASLIDLLRHVQSGAADRVSIERRVREALREMRLAIDVLWRHGNGLDLAALGTLCYRIDTVLRASGLRPEAKAKPCQPPRQLQSRLTAREIQVLDALSQGCTYAEIAFRLGVSLNTVTSHIKNSYRKLAVHSGAAAVTRAAELGLLRLSGNEPPAR